MAITSESQILNKQKVLNSTQKLGDANRYLRLAVESLRDASLKCDAEALSIDGEAVLQPSINELIQLIEDEIAKINTTKSNIISDTDAIITSERASYNAYKQEQEAAANKPAATQQQSQQEPRRVQAQQSGRRGRA